MQAVCRFFYRRKYVQTLLLVGAERSENRPMRLLRASCFRPSRHGFSRLLRCLLMVTRGQRPQAHIIACPWICGICSVCVSNILLTLNLLITQIFCFLHANQPKIYLWKILTRLQYVPFSTLKRTVWHCETVRFSVPNSPFRNTKRYVLLSPWVTASYRANINLVRFWNILTTIFTPASSFPPRSKCAIHPLNLTIHSFVTQETPWGTRRIDG